MCEPGTIAAASLALAATSTAASVFSQVSQSKQQAAMAEQQARNDLAARNQNLGAIEAQRAADGRDLTETMHQNTQAATRAQATARTSAGESGVAGLSVDALLRDLAGQAGNDNSDAAENFRRQGYQSDAQAASAQTTYQSQVNSIRSPQRPDYLGAGLALGQSAIGIASNYNHSRNRQLAAAQTK